MSDALFDQAVFFAIQTERTVVNDTLSSSVMSDI